MRLACSTVTRPALWYNAATAVARAREYTAGCHAPPRSAPSATIVCVPSPFALFLSPSCFPFPCLAKSPSTAPVKAADATSPALSCTRSALFTNASLVVGTSAARIAPRSCALIRRTYSGVYTDPLSKTPSIALVLGLLRVVLSSRLLPCPSILFLISFVISSCDTWCLRASSPTCTTPYSRSSSSISLATSSKYFGVISSPSTRSISFALSLANTRARLSQCTTSTFSAGGRSVICTLPPLSVTSRLISSSRRSSVRYSLPFRVYKSVLSRSPIDLSLLTSSMTLDSLKRTELVFACAVANAA
mmetsp:Transcript_4845/g.17905  ORF Transcript_4845/g.17905 Transcript_4845/m.17905 type:complete len:304 (-) Transcript_4845:89-1000(-)